MLKWLNGINSSALDCRRNIYACNPFTFQFYAVGKLSDLMVWHSGFLFPSVFFFQLSFLSFPARVQEYSHKGTLTLQSLLMSVIPVLCHICLSITHRHKDLQVWAPFQWKRRHQPSVIFFSSAWKESSAVRKNAFTLEYDKQQNEMNRHEASVRQQQANVFFSSFKTLRWCPGETKS